MALAVPSRRRGISAFGGFTLMLFQLLFRILSGERYRKATPAERRWYGAAFVFLPIFLLGFAFLGNSYLERAGGFGIWLYAMACLLVAALVIAAWARYVPPRVSAIAALVVWVITFWAVWHIDLAKFGR
jgi:hypothetical protein